MHDVYVDLLLRGRMRLGEEKTAEVEILHHLTPVFRVKHWLKKLFVDLSDDARHSMCVARVAAEEIAHLRERTAGLEAELATLKGK